LSNATPHVPASLEIENPGDLVPGLQANNLIYCVPAYRNFLLAEGMRFAGFADNTGNRRNLQILHLCGPRFSDI
jgi:hypothetical protein